MPCAGKEVVSHVSLSVTTATESDTKESKTYQSCTIYMHLQLVGTFVESWKGSSSFVMSKNKYLGQKTTDQNWVEEENLWIYNVLQYFLIPSVG